MNKTEETISVSEAAELLNATRGTISYWIKRKKLCANRVGRNYKIPLKELYRYLKSSGREIPSALQIDFLHPVFNLHIPCWKYWQGSLHGKGCKDCVVYRHRVEFCITAKNSDRLYCDSSCHACSYYQDIYLPRIQFIHQIDLPAAVCKGMFFWGVNSGWASMTHAEINSFPGTGVEQIFEPQSLAVLIGELKKRELGEMKAFVQRIAFNNRADVNPETMVTLSPLNEPSDAILLLAAPLLPQGGGRWNHTA